jgi:hypothetical protein
MPRVDAATRFVERLECAVADAECALGSAPVADALATYLTRLTVDRFGVQGARRGLQILLIGLARLDEDPDPPPRLGGVPIWHARSVAITPRQYADGMRLRRAAAGTSPKRATTR